MTHRDGAALLKAILDAPVDDLPRLACADWLDEQGAGSRANYVRREVRAARIQKDWLPHESDGLEWPDSLSRLAGARDASTLRQAGWRWDWRRGFIERVFCPLAEWVSHGRAVALAHPLTRVELTDRRPYFRDFGRSHARPRAAGADAGNGEWVWQPEGDLLTRWLDSLVNYGGVRIPLAVYRNLDRYGHPTPDEALAALSAALIATAREA
jgi:uncharacterized protein (TIGR02996 family)